MFRSVAFTFLFSRILLMFRSVAFTLLFSHILLMFRSVAFTLLFSHILLMFRSVASIGFLQCIFKIEIFVGDDFSPAFLSDHLHLMGLPRISVPPLPVFNVLRTTVKDGLILSDARDHRIGFGEIITNTPLHKWIVEEQKV